MQFPVLTEPTRVLVVARAGSVRAAIYTLSPSTMVQPAGNPAPDHLAEVVPALDLVNAGGTDVERLRDLEEERNSAARMMGLLLLRVTSGMTVSVIVLLAADAPWPTAAAGVVLMALAYSHRDHPRITAPLSGAGLSILLAWAVVAGGGSLVSQF